MNWRLLLAVADLDGDITDMPVWFQVFFLGVIAVIICFAVWTFLPVRRKSRRGLSDVTGSTDAGPAEPDR